MTHIMPFYNVLRILLYEMGEVKGMGPRVLKWNGTVKKYMLAL